MALIELVEQEADADLVREMLAFAAERMMEMEIEAKTGAAAGTRSPERLNHRNGYRERAWDTRAGRIELAIPKLRKGSCARNGRKLPLFALPAAPRGADVQVNERRKLAMRLAVEEGRELGCTRREPADPCRCVADPQRLSQFLKAPGFFISSSEPSVADLDFFPLLAATLGTTAIIGRGLDRAPASAQGWRTTDVHIICHNSSHMRASSAPSLLSYGSHGR
jgi:hypothetical protein